MAILITGGAGAVGSNLARLLHQKGLEVTILDDFSSGYKDNLKDLPIHLVQGSVEDADLVNTLFESKKFDNVFHMAAFFANQNSVDHPVSDLKVNGLGILNVLQSSLRYGIRKVIYTSSSCVYGALEDMKEDVLLPISCLDTPYAITKLLGEQYCQFFAHHYGLDTVCARLFNAYGPGERPGKYRNVIPNFIELAMKGESLIITGTGQETRDFTFVEDTVEGLYHMSIVKTKPGDVFNIGSGKETTLIELTRSINELTHNQSPIFFKEKRSWDGINKRVANISKAQSLLGFQPKWGLVDGLRKTISWFQNGW